MQTRAVCAIRLYDDFTGQMLKGPEYQFKVNGLNYKPICKPDGYFVLTNIEEPSIILEVSAKHYKSYLVSIDTHTLNPLCPVYDMRLLSGPLAMNGVTKRLRGNIKTPNTWVIAVPELEKPMFKYGGIEGEEGEEWMIINSLGYESLLNYLFIIKDNQSGPAEVFCIKNKKGHNLFKASPRLSKKYKVNQEVVRIYRTLSEEDGSFDIPIDTFYDSTKYTLMYDKEGKWVHETVTL